MAGQGDTSQTLGRGLDVLELLAASSRGWTPSQIATELGLSRTIVYRLTGTLIEHGLVRRNADGLLAIGLATMQLSANIHPVLRESTRGTLERLADETGASAHFVVADGGDAVAVSVVEPQSSDFRVAYRVGSRTPLGVGALGKAIAAAQEGTSGIYTSEGEIFAGACGVAASLPGLPGLAAAIGVVTLSSIDSSSMIESTRRAADELSSVLGAV